MLTPDLLYQLYPLLSLKDSYHLSQVHQEGSLEFKGYLRQRGYTHTNVSYLKRVFRTWKSLQTKPRKIINSWIKPYKDPERPILLF